MQRRSHFSRPTLPSLGRICLGLGAFVVAASGCTKEESAAPPQPATLVEGWPDADNTITAFEGVSPNYAVDIVEGETAVKYRRK